MNNLNFTTGSIALNGSSNITSSSGIGISNTSVSTSISNLYGNGTSTGIINTAIGYNSLGTITTGNNNIALGYSALSGYSTELLEFYDMMLEALGYDDNKREDFFKLSKEERKSILREVKINRVLNK